MHKPHLMTIRTNEIMNAYLKQLNYDFEKTAYVIPDKLIKIIQADFMDDNDCIILKLDNNHKHNPVLHSDFEKCDYEYNEHFHPDFAVIGVKEDETEYLKLALECGKALALRLKSNYPEKEFRIVISFSETRYEGQEIDSLGSSRVSFHQIRQSAEWAFRIDNLNDYKSEAIMNIEV